MNNNSNGGTHVVTVVQIVLIILKLLELIDWSWWAVFAPTLVSTGVFLILLLIAIILENIT